MLLAIGVTMARLLARIWLGPSTNITYDEGAYYTAAALLADGAIPYRDFVLAHPPGLTIFLAPFTTLSGDVSTAFVVCRAVMAVMGGVNAYLVGSIARAYCSRGAALGAMVVYLLLPEVASSERQVLVEPLLNLFCLLAARHWLVDRRGRSWQRRSWGTGLLLALALCCKLWAVFMLVPVLATTTSSRRLAELSRVLGGLAVGSLALIAPMLVLAPSEFFAQALQFQLLRPGDSMTWELLTTRASIVLGLSSNGRALPATVILLLALASAAVARRRDMMTVFALVWAGTLVAVFLLGPSYMIQYNAHLGPAIALAAASAIDCALQLGRDVRWTSVRVRVVAATAIAVLALSAAVAVRGLNLTRARGSDAAADRTAEAAAVLRSSQVPAGCIFSLDPSWLIAGDLLADVEQGAPLASDPFAGILSESTRSGRADEGFGSPAAQAAVQDAIDRCDAVMLGGNASWMLSDATYAEFRRDFVRVAAADGPGVEHGAPDLWIRQEVRRP